MSAKPKPRKMTEAEYLASEKEAEFKSEFYDGEVFAMSGASPAHNILKENLIIEIGSQLRGGSCQSYSSDQRVNVSATGLYTYPDIAIVCGPAEYLASDPHTLTNPQVLIEVLSPSTEAYDRGTKFRHYQQLASVQEIVLVSQDCPKLERFVRQSDETWVLTTFDDPTGSFTLATIPVKVLLADLYRNIELPKNSPLR